MQQSHHDRVAIVLRQLSLHATVSGLTTHELLFLTTVPTNGVEETQPCKKPGLPENEICLVTEFLEKVYQSFNKCSMFNDLSL